MNQRKPLIAGNWKMHKTVAEAVEFVNALQAEIGDEESVDRVVSPPAIALSSVVESLRGSSIQVAAQNVHPKSSGAFTGELSVSMLTGVGVSACIIGHSERRQIFGESDAFIREKLDALLAVKLMPIFCLGESLEERESGKTFDRVAAQLRAGFEGLTIEQASQIVVAYEPIWAIGTGKTASPEQAQEVHAFLRKQLAELTSDSCAAQIRILYGGSVKPANVRTLMSQVDIDGALVGGASLNVDPFVQIVRFQQP